MKESAKKAATKVAKKVAKKATKKVAKKVVKKVQKRDSRVAAVKVETKSETKRTLVTQHCTCVFDQSELINFVRRLVEMLACGRGYSCVDYRLRGREGWNAAVFEVEIGKDHVLRKSRQALGGTSLTCTVSELKDVISTFLASVHDCEKERFLESFIEPNPDNDYEAVRTEVWLRCINELTVDDYEDDAMTWQDLIERLGELPDYLLSKPVCVDINEDYRYELIGPEFSRQGILSFLVRS